MKRTSCILWYAIYVENVRLNICVICLICNMKRMCDSKMKGMCDMQHDVLNRQHLGQLTMWIDDSAVCIYIYVTWNVCVMCDMKHETCVECGT